MPSRGRIHCLATIAIAIAVGVIGQAQARLPKGRVVFRSARGDGYEIYVMDADGTSLQNLSNAPRALHDMPDWSPDGRHIVFVSARDSNDEIYVMSATGANQRRITQHPGLDWRPRWSPDGLHIAFMRYDGHVPSVLVMNPDGSDVRIVVERAESPAWSPDGREIAFVSTVDGGLHRVGLHGGDSTPIAGATSHGGAASPSWAPHGGSVAFALRDGQRSVLHVTSLETHQTRRVDTGGAYAASPVWTSGGSHLLFTSGSGSRSSLRTARPDGTDARSLTAPGSRDDNASWLSTRVGSSRARRRPSVWGWMRQIGLRR
jgi:Tol biopolymer transport system component